RPGAQQSDGLRQGREAIRAAVLGVEVDEFPDFTRVFADRLKLEMLDEHRGETLLVLDLHAVENAAVRVDPDEEFLRGFEVPQDLRRVHTIPSRFKPCKSRMRSCRRGRSSWCGKS